MTTTAASSSRANAGILTARAPRAVAVRRWFLICCPVLAGLCAVVGAAADPAVGLDGEQLWALYAQHPDPLQVKSLAFHWSYAFWMAPALLLAAYVRGKGAWISNVAALVGFAGMTTLPGLLFIDYYDSAIGQVAGVETTAAVAEHMEATMWGPPVFVAPGIAGLVLALPLAALALWRAGLVRWWALASVIAGFAAFVLSGITWWGATVTTLCFSVFAVAIERATRPGVDRT